MTPAEVVAKAAKNSEQVTSLRYRVVGTVPDVGRLRVEASMTAEPLAMSMEMTANGQGEDGRTEIRFVDGVMYVGGPAVTSSEVFSGKLDGKTWVRAAPAVWGRGAVDNNSYGMLPRQIEGSPVVQSTILTGSKDVRKIGAESIDGTRTTQYRGTVTSGGLRAARDAAADKATQERQVESLDQFLGLHADDVLTMDLWIDHDGHVKQFRLRGETYNPRGGSAGEPFDLTTTFLEVNQPPTIAVPEAKDTADVDAFADDAAEG
ncbi:hypothetical protein [Streptomyces sp. AC550_RSS872]|uniref:hypothetical protein n=1 Tax=Streptomyces sp. AC550_RSS872 TaxID=2823689 RepID=UPI001C27AD72|nr:hypothetical protein [Streptomyces sp. AC550_RSS872]